MPDRSAGGEFAALCDDDQRLTWVDYRISDDPARGVALWPTLLSDAAIADVVSISDSMDRKSQPERNLHRLTVADIARGLPQSAFLLVNVLRDNHRVCENQLALAHSCMAQGVLVATFAEDYSKRAGVRPMDRVTQCSDLWFPRRPRRHSGMTKAEAGTRDVSVGIASLLAPLCLEAYLKNWDFPPMRAAFSNAGLAAAVSAAGTGPRAGGDATARNLETLHSRGIRVERVTGALAVVRCTRRAFEPDYLYQVHDLLARAIPTNPECFSIASMVDLTPTAHVDLILAGVEFSAI